MVGGSLGGSGKVRVKVVSQGGNQGDGQAGGYLAGRVVKVGQSGSVKSGW